MHCKIARPLAWCALAALVLGIAGVGCFLQTISGATFQAGNALITTVRTDAILATCVQSSFTSYNVECSYIFMDENGVPVEVSSSAILISEFGLLGVLVDPLILQVPTPVSDVTATFDDGSGAQPLVVTETSSFDVDAFRTMDAEPGTTFLIFELPGSVTRSLPTGPPEGAPRFSFSVSFTVPDVQPHVVKALLSIRLDVADRTFFLPQIPCVTDMAEVPPITLPVLNAEFDLMPIVAAAFADSSICQNAFFEFSGVSLDDHAYRLWKAKSDTKPFGSVLVTDALGTRNMDLKKTSLLGAPANVNQQDPTAPLSPDHLVAYKVKPSPGQAREEKRNGVEVTNQLGNQTVNLTKADLLLLPAAKDLSGPVPPLAAPGVNPFLCWRTKYARGGSRLAKGFEYLVGDQLGGGVVALKKPTRLCLPADVDGANPGTEEEAVALMCFKAKAGKPRPPGRDGVHTTDAMGMQVLAVKKPAELCLPSVVQLP